MKLSGIKYLTNQGIENIWKNKMMAFATFCVLLISLLLVGCSALFYINMDSMILGLGSNNEVSVFIQDGTSQDRIKEIGEQIKGLDNISTVTYISKEDAYKRAQNQVPQGERIYESYISDSDFMPDGFSVTVNEVEKIDATVDAISRMDDVDSVSSSPNVAEFLRELRRVVTLVASAAIIALASVSLIMISNTTKASVFSRREEIQIMKYVGATNAFIRTPFFVEGLVTGFFSGAGAFFITWAIYNSVYNILSAQETLMNAIGVGNIIPFSEIRLLCGIVYVVVGAFIGAFGSILSTRKHLDV